MDPELTHQPENSDAEKNIKRSIVNLEELTVISGGDRAFLSEMIRIFLEQVPNDIEKIDTALHSNDFDTIRSSCHRMQTSVGFMGLRNLHYCLKQIEQMAEARTEADQISSLFGHLKTGLLMAQEELKAILKTL